MGKIDLSKYRRANISIDDDEDEVNTSINLNNYKRASNVGEIKLFETEEVKPTVTTKNSVVNNIPTTNADGYADTGKKFGDYYYQEYAKKGQYKVYSKDDNYYYYDEENQTYKPFGNQTWMTTKEQDKKDYEEAVKAGYKGSKDTLKVIDRLKLDTANLTDKEYENYEKDLQRQQNKKNKESNEVRVGGAGLQGTIGEIKNSTQNIKENLIEPISRTPENYKLGQLNEKLGLEAYKKMNGKKNNYDEIKRQIDNYNKFNQDIVNSTNLLDQNTQNLPNQLGGLKSGLKGVGVGGTIGAGIGGVLGAVTTKSPTGTIAGAGKGAKLLGGSGYVTGQAKYAYELEAGYQYQTLLDMGVPEEIAKEEAKKVGTVNALIESVDSILDLITLGKASQAKQLLTDKLVKKYGLEMVKDWTKNAGISYTTNVISEGIEEGLQEKTSIESEKRASEKAGIERDESGDLQRIKDSAIAGSFGALLTGGVTRVAGVGANQTFNNLSNKVIQNQQNKINSNQSIANTVNALNLGKNQTVISQNTLGNINNQNVANPSNIGTNNAINNTSFSKQVDEAMNGTYPKRDMLVVSQNTPKIIQELGIKDLPITMTQKHLDTIVNQQGNRKNVHYHGLGVDLVKQIPEALSRPLNILQSDTKDNSIVVVTDLADSQERPVIASIEINGKGTIQDIRIDSNVMTSAYGRNNYDNFMQNNITKGNILYDIDEGVIKQKRDNVQGLQLPNEVISTKSARDRVQFPMRGDSSVDNISQNEQNVNFDTSTTNNDMQKSNKNAKNEFYENKIDDDVLVIKDSQNNKENKVTRKNINDFNLEDANTTPNLNKVKVETGNGKSSFYNNITNKTKMLTEENRTKLSAESDIEFYKEVTNKESLDEAYQRLNDGGASETLNWLNKKSEQATATDIAEGWILLKQYQDVGDYDSMVQVAKKMREMGTKAGQTVQAFNIMSRLTPEGMVKYAQSELTEAYNIMVKNKTKEWINKNASNFDLTPQETQFIVDTMKEVATMEDGYNKKVKLAEIQKMLQDKLPPEKGAGIKSWMRISMLFNPKTQVRNVMGNAVIAPVNMVADAMSAFADKQVAKKTGVRTTGITNIKQYGKGFKEGVYQSYNDFKKGINTRDMQGNRFEIGQGKSFKNNNILGKSLNKIDSILNFALDVGDRPFYEAAFTNSINNQLVLNNTTEVTQDMIDIATQEALSRTWQDNNNYTKMVLNIRRNLNLNSNRYGLGDVLIPFAKTPANLTKAIVDYSPAGLVKAILEGNNLKKSLSNGQYDIKQQHKFVQDLGKATAGTMLHVLGFALAKAKITSGENDEDKDVADFMKNTLGIQPYSIKIGNKSFTYDWAQPVAAPFAITANFINNTNEEAKLYEKLLSAMDAGFNLILEQSFMSSIQNVLSNIGGVPEGIMNQILDLPARAVPTFLKQVNDLIDGTTRTSFEKGEPVKTATNKVKSKVPGLSTGLAISRDSLGRKVEKYGGDNNIFNVFLNPANVNKGKESESAKEIYKVYQATGDKTVMPRVTPYSITLNGKTKTLSAEERSEFQKISGEIVEQNVKKLTTNNKYKKLSDEDKAEVIYGIVGFAYNKAKSEVLDTEVSTTYKTANKYVEKGGALYDFYADKVYRNRN